MYDPQVGQFLSEDPIGFDGDPSNLHRYVSNAPTLHTDPTGLWAKPIPTPAPGPPPPPVTNTPMCWYRRPYGLAPLPIPKKPSIIKKLGEIRPKTCGTPLSGVTGGSHQFSAYPLPAGTYFGVTGTGPCIGVVVHCGTQLATFHFSATDDAGATISQYKWPSGSIAAICGGNNTAVSNDQMIEVIKALKQEGISIQGVINMDGCFWGPGPGPGDWHVGSTNKPSQDDSKKR